MGNGIKRFLSKVLDGLFPPDVTCNNCLRELTDEDDRAHALCRDCLANTSFFGDRILHVDRRLFHCDTLATVFLYEGTAKNLVLRYKDGNREYLYKVISDYMTECCEKLFKNRVFDVICFVPTCRRKKLKRGYDHMELLAKTLSKRLEIPMANATKASFSVVDQTETAERFKNVSGVFSVIDEDIVKGKRILLIDDVIASGATLSEVAKTLTVVGGRVEAMLTFAIGPIRARDMGLKPLEKKSQIIEKP